MKSDQTPATQPPSSVAHAGDETVLDAAFDVLVPLARLLIAHGLKFGQAEELLKRAFVTAGARELEKAGAKANVSQVSVGTGIHRKDVKRLLEAGPGDTASVKASGRSFASELYTRWATDPIYRTRAGTRVLPQRAAEGKPSFESLARSVSTDVHPRSLLEELRRLGLVSVDDDAGTVALVPGGFVPSAEGNQIVALLGANLGDHLRGAVGNVLGDSPRWVEQAVFADGLSAESFAQVDAEARRLWKDAMRRLVPMLEGLIREDEAAGRATDARVRIGLYAFGETAGTGAGAVETRDASEGGRNKPSRAVTGKKK